LHGAHLRGLDFAALAAVARELLEAAPRTPKELGACLQERWPQRPTDSLAHAARGTLPLVQLPPRGLWGRSGQVMLTTAQAWLGRPLATPDPDELVCRYLGAFGPATVQDAQTWSGLTGLREVFDRLGPRLRRLRDERGRELFDVPDAPRPDPDTPAPVRFLAEFDNLLVSHAERSRVIAAERMASIGARREPWRGVLVDGEVKATWKLVRERGGTHLLVEHFCPLTAEERAEVNKEGHRLLAFAVPRQTAPEIRFAPR
ncbi:MAG: AlkZ family DNA glycosylase, partial [Frankia sp.]|nr:AlkZ family DNA glycosylase [Frankia sp.]